MEMSPIEKMLDELKQEDVKSSGKRQVVVRGLICAITKLRAPMVFERWAADVGVECVINTVTDKWDGQNYIYGVLSVIRDMSSELYYKGE